MNKIHELINRTEAALPNCSAELRGILQDWLQYESDIGSDLLKVSQFSKQMVRMGLSAQMREVLEVLEPFARVGSSLRTPYGVNSEDLYACSFPAKNYLRAAELYNKYFGSNTKAATVSISLGDTDGNEGERN